jgi:GNAT superfamily N-acetyltransferase
MRASLAWHAYRAALQTHPDATEIPVHQINNGQVLVASQAGKIIGFVALEFEGRAEIDGLFVNPDSWRAGIGRRLIGWADTVAVKRGCTTIWVTANTEAAGFYEKCGFVRFGTVETRFARAVRMNKRVG